MAESDIGNNLKRARLLKGLSLAKAGQLLGMSATAVQKYESGKIIPNSEKLIEFANIYQVKVVSLLKVYHCPEIKFSSFRKKKKLTGQRLNLLKETIQNEVAKYLEVLELSNNKNNINIKKYDCNSLENAEQLAYKFRKKIGYSNLQPILNITNSLENLGFVIIQIKDDENFFNGFDGANEIINNIPFIFILHNKDGAKQRFTIAHELSHLILNINNKELEEKICDRFAASFLMPKDAVINEFGSIRRNISLYELKTFKEEYKVSFMAITYRLKDLNIISEYTYKKLCIVINQKIGKNDLNPIQPEVSYNLKKLVHKLTTDETITINKACELLGETTDEYNKENNNY